MDGQLIEVGNAIGEHSMYKSKLMATTTNSREYKVAQGRYGFCHETKIISRRPYKNWKLARKTQYKTIKVSKKRIPKNGEHWRYKRHQSWGWQRLIKDWWK